VRNLLESIPEWSDYVGNQLKRQNEIESKPLGQDAKGSKKTDSSDDFLDMMFKMRDNSQKGGASKKQNVFSVVNNLINSQENGGNEEDDEDEDINKIGDASTNPLLKGFTNDEEEDEEDDS
jgi:hypothetical protein